MTNLKGGIIYGKEKDSGKDLLAHQRRGTEPYTMVSDTGSFAVGILLYNTSCMAFALFGRIQRDRRSHTGISALRSDRHLVLDARTVRGVSYTRVVYREDLSQVLDARDLPHREET